MMKPLPYQCLEYHIIWSNEESQYCGTCPNHYPSLSFFADTPTDALTGIMQTVKEVMEDIQTNGQ